VNTAYLLLGSNLGDRELQLQHATQHISRQMGEVITTTSRYQTAAWGVPDQPDFVNQVVVLRTGLSPGEAMTCIQHIESRMGRSRTGKWSARTIDIDILLWNNEIIDLPGLTIPHPGIRERRFVLVPLSEVASDLVHPVYQKTIGMLLEECRDELSVVRITGTSPTGSSPQLQQPSS
jgi:2-amino-4-hydroxy-6-hydroxymethyldihydropteridine diphosphokinase